jgi:uncharacterized small protein (DUF1192 family)
MRFPRFLFSPDPVVGGSQTAAGQGGQPPSAPPVQGQDGRDSSEEARSKGFAHGHREARKELLGELGFQSVDELKVAIGGLRDSAARTEAKKLAEQQEREALAIELAKTRQEAERLKKDADQLAGLRDQLRLGRIRAAAIEAGILPDAADLALADLGGVVRWDAQFKELLVHDEQGQPTATTVADLFKAQRALRKRVSEAESCEPQLIAQGAVELREIRHDRSPCIRRRGPRGPRG